MASGGVPVAGVATSSSSDSRRSCLKKVTGIEGISDEVLFALQNMTLDPMQKVTKLLPGVLRLLFRGIEDPSDVLNLRLVSRDWKYAVDGQIISSSCGLGDNQEMMPTISLPNHAALDAFKRDMIPYQNSNLGPIPFTLTVGLGTLESCLMGIPIWGGAVVEVYWETFLSLCQRIGSRVAGLSLDFGHDNNLIDPNLERIGWLVVNGLKQVPNLQALFLNFHTVRMENLLCKQYQQQQVRRVKHCKLPVLEKLKTLEMVTTCQNVQDAKSTPDFLNRFMRQHGGTLKRLYLRGSLEQMTRNGVVKGAGALEVLSLDILDVAGKRGVEPHLERMPKVEVNPEKLIEVNVKLSWNWRACDVRGMLKWLEAHYSGCELQTLSLESHRNLVKDLIEEEESWWFSVSSSEEEEDSDASSSDEHQCGSDCDLCVPGLDELFDQMKSIRRKERSVGNDIIFSEWVEQLKLPKVKYLSVTTEYNGSWRWLTGFPRQSLKTLEIVYHTFNPEGSFEKGFLDRMMGKRKKEKGLAKEEEVIWDMFPRMQVLITIWIKPREFSFGFLTRAAYEDFLEEQKNEEKRVENEIENDRVKC